MKFKFLIMIQICCSLLYRPIFGNNPAEVEFDNPYLKNNTYLSDIYRECLSARDMKKIKIKKDHMQSNGSLFNYHYVYQKLNEFQTTVIYLPGGPGSGSILEATAGALKSGFFNQILIDPRGTNCNYFGPNDFSLQTINSVQTAFDVVEVIKTENLNNYIIYGHSYGTLLGTIVAHLISKDPSIQKPKALVLEGTMGHSYSHASDYVQDHIDIVNELLNTNPKIKKIFKEHPEPMGYDLKAWTGFFMSIPRFGINDFKNDLYPNPWSLLVQAEPYLNANLEVPHNLISEMKFYMTLNEELDQTSRQISENDMDSEFLMNTIVCQEIADEIPWVYTEISIHEGNLILGRTPRVRNSCGNIKMDLTYDSLNFPFSIPTLYLQGTHDAQTPILAAKYHFASNRSVNKKFIQIEGAGHSPSYFELNGCLSDLFLSISKDTSLDVSKVLNSSGHCKKTSIHQKQQKRPRQRRI